MVAKLFAAFLNEQITYSEFLKSSLIVEKTFIEDLKFFIESDWEELPIGDAGDYINSGLLEFYTEETSVEDQWDYKMSNKYIVSGGEAKTFITPIGLKIRAVLKK